MPERTQRIVAAAIKLADQGGFQAVRLRDVAAEADVALGTLYARFRSKEDILMAALEDEAVQLEHILTTYPPEGSSIVERVSNFFAIATRGLFVRPNFARAVLRSVASGEPNVATKVLQFHQRMTELIVCAYRGEPIGFPDSAPPTEVEQKLCFMMQQIWFAILVGWMGGLHDEESVIEQIQEAAAIVLGERPWVK